MRVAVLIVATLFFLRPLDCLAQAQLLFKGSAEPIGTCGGELLFVGKRPPVVHSGLYRTKRKSFSLVRDYYDLGGSVGTPWGVAPGIPSLNKPVPLLVRKGISARSTSLAATCGSVKSTKVVLPGYYPSLSHNFVVDNVDIIIGRNSRSATTLLRFDGAGVTPIASIQGKNKPNENGVVSDPTILHFPWGIVFPVGESSSGLTRLWMFKDGVTNLLTDFSELESEGYSNIEVGNFTKTGPERLFVTARAINPSGQEESLFFYADGTSTRRLPDLPQNVLYRGYLQIPGLNGVVLQVENLNPGAIQCGLFLLSFDDDSFRDITALFGEELQNIQNCIFHSAIKFIGSSAFLSDPKNSDVLTRVNLKTSQRTELFKAPGAIRLFYERDGRLYFSASVPDGGEGLLYVSDGTTAGTVPITFKGRTLRGADIEKAVEHKGSLYLPAYTRLRGDNILDYGLYGFQHPVGPVTE